MFIYISLLYLSTLPLCNVKIFSKNGINVSDYKINITIYIKLILYLGNQSAHIVIGLLKLLLRDLVGLFKKDC